MHPDRIGSHRPAQISRHEYRHTLAQRRKAVMSTTADGRCRTRSQSSRSSASTRNSSSSSFSDVRSTSSPRRSKRSRRHRPRHRRADHRLSRSHGHATGVRRSRRSRATRQDSRPPGRAIIARQLARTIVGSNSRIGSGVHRDASSLTSQPVPELLHTAAFDW